MSAEELTSVVSAWQSGALSRGSMLDLFRWREVLPEGHTNPRSQQHARDGA
jgi:hypothetical protein